MKRHASSDLALTGRLSTVLLVVVVLAFAGYVYMTNNDKAEASVVTTEPVNAESPRPAFIPVANVADVAPQESMHPIGHVVSGDMVGLYGGTQTNTCDTAKIGTFLDANPQLANAWATALRIQPGQIHLYLASLTALVLRTDTAVTNHGYEKGVATPFQSVLQAGTAVFVDAEGLPRVRCRCGNPLQTPAPPRQNVQYVGPTWKGFEPESVTAIGPASKEVKDFVVVDHDNKVKSRPRATSGAKDRDVDPPIAVIAYQSLSVNRSSTDGGSSNGDRHETGSPTGTDVSTAGATASVSTAENTGPSATVAPGSAPTIPATMTVEPGTVSPTATEVPPVTDGNTTNTAVVTVPNVNPDTINSQPVSPESQRQQPDNQLGTQQTEQQQPQQQQPQQQQPQQQQPQQQQQPEQQQPQQQQRQPQQQQQPERQQQSGNQQSDNQQSGNQQSDDQQSGN